MINFTATLLKFDKKGEKTGWTYIEISAKQANKLKPRTKVSFRVKGKMDDCPLEQVALLPVGDGGFILPVNAGLRRKIKKRAGHQVKMALAADLDPFVLSADLMACLNDDLDALDYFNTLPGSHQRYFSKWIDSAKTAATKDKRIVMAVKALSLKMGYAEMIRANKALG